MKKQIVHILMTDYLLDSRVKNETVSLVNDGYELSVYCLKSRIISNDELRENVLLKRFGIIGNKYLTFISAYIAMFFYSMNKKIDLIHAHDLNSLPIAYLISFIKKVPFIYDSHELWSQSHHSIKLKFVLRIVGLMEKFFAKRATKIITVSDSIKEYLENYFCVNDIEVIRNIPSYTHMGNYNLLREKFNLPNEIKICLYQGMISEHRGVSLIVKSAIEVCKNNNNVVFFFLGDGEHLDTFKKLIKENELDEKIFFLGRIEQDKLLKYTMSADIGIHAISNTCLNHEYCLPNKVFEYLHSNLVLVVTNLFELSKFIEENKIGLTFIDNDYLDLETKIIELLTNESLYLQYKDNVKNVASKLTWSNEYLKLRNIYRDLLK
ncbi:glycosyltransferase [Aliarcobacter cryaerophilus]|uniref:glycosyltransferase n=1 Tax=Aliarcobacter cryaerophilus TaxID=28198 RepID=UPI00112F205F|nr:glycosyltransferase [Aliarcobacter cryaerophilus]